jgi:hypothetical protein
MSDSTNISNLSEDTGNGKILNLSKKELNEKRYFLNGKTVGISVSQSEDLKQLGYSNAHVNDAIIEIARYILVLGGKLSYGGDMRPGGFTSIIFDLLLNYNGGKELQPYERFFNYLAYPISTTLKIEDEAKLKRNVSFVKVSPPADLNISNSGEFISPDSPQNLYIWARSLSYMREEMEASCNARIFVGGSINTFKGKCPGILEEVLTAIRHNHPIFLVGAFGGMTKEIICALKGEETHAFSNDNYLSNDMYKELFKIYNTKHPDDQIDFPAYLNLLKVYGFHSISKNNGLSIEDNLRLSSTPHISEIVYLILKGITASFGK